MNTATATAAAPASAEIVLAGGLAFVDGVIANDRHNARTALPEWVEMQTEKIFSNLDEILAPHGLTRAHVVSVRVNLVQYERLHARFDIAWAQCMADSSAKPSRSCVGVSALPRSALVSMDFVLARQAA